MSRSMDPAPLDGQGRVWLKGMTRPRLIAWATQTLGARETQAELIWAGLHRQLAPTIAEFLIIAITRLLSAGITVRKACGRTIRRIVLG